MRLPSSQTILCLTFGMLLLSIGWPFWQALSFRDSSLLLTKGEPIKLLPGETASQTLGFKPNTHLRSIEFLVRNPEPKKGDTVTVTLADALCQHPLREARLMPGLLQSDNLFVADFDDPYPITSSEPFCVLLHFDDTSTQSKYLRFFTSEIKLASTLELRLGGDLQVDRSLSLRPVYTTTTLAGNLATLNERLSQYKPWFLKGGFLTGIVGLCIMSTIGIVTLLILVIQKENPTHKG